RVAPAATVKALFVEKVSGPQRTDIDIGCARIRAGTAQCQRPGATLWRPPTPPIVPPSVSLLPLVSTVPPPALSVVPRFEVNPERNCSVPPLKASPPEAAPKLASVVTASVPALIAVPPVYVLTPLSVSVPAPLLVTPPMPP